jgi:hypothetical protein
MPPPWAKLMGFSNARSNGKAEQADKSRIKVFKCGVLAEQRAWSLHVGR